MLARTFDGSGFSFSINNRQAYDSEGGANTSQVVTYIHIYMNTYVHAAVAVGGVLCVCSSLNVGTRRVNM